MPRVLATADGDGQWWPYLKLRIKTPTETIEISSAILDSGADETSIPEDLLPVLGIRKTQLRPHGQLMGVTGTAPYFKADAQVWWKQWKICDEIGVMPAGAPVLVGRNDFFAKFVVKFLWDRTPPVMDIDPVAKRR